jgi:hypothetical protein
MLVALKKYPGILSAYPFGDSMHVTFDGDEYDEGLIAYLKDNGIEKVVIEESQAGIEDRFLKLMEKDIIE